MPRKGQTRAAEAGGTQKASVLSDVSPPFIMPGGLTPEQLASRGKGLGGSDARLIMEGGAAWLQLWRIKTGIEVPEDLSGNLAVQMGVYTEPFNAWWFEKQTGWRVNRAPAIIDQTFVHPQRAWQRCNLDGIAMVDGRRRLFEAKHTNSFGTPGEQVAQWYPQIQHCLEVLALEGAHVSVFFGNGKWEQFPIERDAEYGEMLSAREAEFWEYVEKGLPPPGDTRPIKPSAEAIGAMKAVNMTRNNSWVDNEATWEKERQHVEVFKAAEKALKEMIPEDANFAFGQILVCVRDRGNKLSLRIPNKSDQQRIEAQELAERSAEAAENVAETKQGSYEL